MDYTRYLIEMIKSQGAPQMNERSAEKIFKIVYLEGRVHGLRTANKKMEGSAEPHKFSLEYLRMGQKLTELTGNRPPKDVFSDILND